MQFSNTSSLALSVVLVSYNMDRELPRTIHSLSHQTNIESDCYEIIVVDNGSKESVDVDSLLAINPRLRFFRYPTPSVSPIRALNFGISLAAGELVCACIDGARMATPGLLSSALAAASLSDRAVIGSLSFHLGHRPQNESVKRGYNQASEDALLETVDWKRDSYFLFDISSFDPSSRYGVFSLPAETNSLFMNRQMWTETGGFENRFETKGGGLANLDIWAELCNDRRNTIAILWGEGTFHQVHGGVATNAVDSPWEVFDEEYRAIRGHNFTRPARIPTLFGTTSDPFLRFVLNHGSKPYRIPTLGETIINLARRASRRLLKRS
jgi:glycosyltransferase involved in cell wall biosynthesis